MKKYIVVCCSFIVGLATAQIGVGTQNPHATAALEIMSLDKGVLFPRLTNQSINTILNPATGLIVYNTDKNGFYAFNGSIWTQDLFHPNFTWELKGNNFTSYTYVGTRDSNNFSFATNGKKALTISKNGSVSINGSDLQLPRLYIAPPQKNSQFPAIAMSMSLNYVPRIFLTTVIATNNTFTGPDDSGVIGTYAFATSTENANIGKSAAGMSYVQDGSVNGLSFYIGGHPTNVEDRSKEVMIIADTHNVGIGVHIPKSKMHIASGDLYIADPTRGLVLKDNANKCRRITVDDTGKLIVSGIIVCP